MEPVEPVEPESSFGAYSGLIVFLVAAGLLLLGITIFLIFQVVGSSESTTTVAAAPSTTTTSSLTTVSTQLVTTTTTAPITTTTEPEEDPNPFVGWWKATDVDDSHLDLRVDGEGTFMYWDSASGVCQARGLGHSPETWAGTATFQLEGVIPTLVAAGSRTCHPYGDDSADAGEASWEWFYDLETDMLEFAPDGVLYTRSPPPLEGGDSNPFVGSWEATDSDGTRISMMIASDGTWESLDTRSGGCENMGLTYATWSAAGVGTFDLDGALSFDVLTTTICHPPDAEPVPRSTDVLFTFEYRPDTDTVALLLFLETTFTRVP